MTSLSEITQKLKAYLPTLKQKYNVSEMAIFGSYVRGEATENSDLDIMIDFNGEIGWDYFDLYNDVQKLFPKIKIDIVTKGGIQPHYWEFLKNKMQYV